MDSKYNIKDIFHFFALYIGAIISVYILPDIFSYIYFGLLLILFWRSEKNAFWFIFVFFIIDPPGDLFPQDFNYGPPFIKGLNLRFIEVFIYASFAKALIRRNCFTSVFIKSYQLLFLLTSVLLLYTFLLDTSVLSLVITIKWLFVWTLLYSIPKLINSIDEWIFIFRIAFIIVFIGFFSQVLHLILGHPPSYLLGTSFNPIVDYGGITLQNLNPNDYDQIEARPISSSSIMQMALIGAMFFMQYKRRIFSKIYLSLVILTAYLSIFLTATRGWFIAFSTVLVLYFIFVEKTRRLLSFSFVSLILLSILLNIIVIRKQLTGSFKRLSTIENVVKGDLSAGGTNSRDEYSRSLIALWEGSPVFGWGFSKFYKDNSNGHAGLANLLFEVGVFGYIIFIYFWYKLFVTPVIINNHILKANPYKGSLLVFSLAFLIFFILHSTSGQQFGIYTGFGAGVFSQTLYYGYSSFFIIESIRHGRFRELS